MRELKFRVWDTQNKCYVENKNGGIEWSIWELEHLGEYKDRVIIEQYTDEYDVNDKEIAEGDIVQYVSANEEALVQATVKYGYPYGYDNDDGTLFVKGFFYDDCKIDDFVDLTEEEYDGLGGTKIIGNIHENAGLLESMARTKREDAEDAPYRNAKLSNWKPEALEPTFRDTIERKTPKEPIDRDKLNSIIDDLNKTDDHDMNVTKRRYRLLKDLPTFKAGETFHISAEGSLVSDNEFSKGIVAYARSTLAKFPSILADWFEEIWPQQLRIVNENMRKCVELWAKLNGYDLLQYNEGDDWCCFYENTENDEIIFSNRKCLNLKDGEFYSTAELCGNEEE